MPKTVKKKENASKAKANTARKSTVKPLAMGNKNVSSIKVNNQILERETVMKVLIALPLLAAAISIIFKVNFMVSIGLFFGIPALLLSLLLPYSIKKSAIFSFLTLPVGFVIDYIVHILGQRVVTESFFPRILDVVPAENIILVFLFTFTTVMFYEYFLDRQQDKALYNKKFVYVYGLFIVAPLMYFILGFIIPELFNIQYFYFVVGLLVAVIPALLFIYRYPGMRLKFVVTGSYFFYLGLIYEMTAIAKSWWFFPIDSKYMGIITFKGFALPIEELVFMLMVYAVAIVAWYEFFYDDRE